MVDTLSSGDTVVAGGGAFRCDPWRTATATHGPGWAARVAAVPELELPARVPDAVVLNAHVDEDLAAAGGLMRRLALHGTDVEVLTVTDGDGARPGDRTLAQQRRLRQRRESQGHSYRRLGLTDLRRRRLSLACGLLDEHTADLVAAISELVGHDTYPGMLCLAPWRGDRHPDHAALGRAAEQVCASYGLRLVSYLADAGTEPADLPWSRARRLTLSPPSQACKRHALVRPVDGPRHRIGEQELFLTHG